MKLDRLISIVADFWARHRQLFVWLAVAGMIWLFVGGQTGFIRIFKSQQLNHRLQRDIDRSRAHRDWLLVERDRLQNDPARIEREARESYGMARKDEIVLKMR
ncbi:septum formation initiator family protein [candidate division KSB1 bacterium]|nr:septum formation initiator family protein [candidate division KSB1 bacterium]